MEYLGELCLQDYAMLQFRPSLTAACVASLALYVTECDCHWPPALAEACGYTWAQMEACMRTLQVPMPACPPLASFLAPACRCSCSNARVCGRGRGCMDGRRTSR